MIKSLSFSQHVHFNAEYCSAIVVCCENVTPWSVVEGGFGGYGGTVGNCVHWMNGTRCQLRPKRGLADRYNNTGARAVMPKPRSQVGRLQDGFAKMRIKYQKCSETTGSFRNATLVSELYFILPGR